MAELAVYASPLPFSNKQIKSHAVVGSTVRDIVNVVCPPQLTESVSAVVFINDHIIAEEYWHVVRPKEGTIVNVRIVPKGGKGKKNPLASILSIAVLVAAPYVGAALAGSLGVTSAFGIAAFRAGVSIVGSMLVSALAPPPKQSNSGNANNPASSPTQFIEGASNSMTPFGVVPICLGTNRMFPLQAAKPYTENQGNDQYVRQMFTYGYGEKITLSDIRIGETSITEFSDVEMDHKLEGNLYETSALYSNDVFQDEFSVLIKHSDGYIIRATQADINEAILDFTFPKGLFGINGNNDQVAATVVLTLDYSLSAADDWQTGTYPISGLNAEALRRSIRLIFPEPGTYDIRVSRVTVDITNPLIFTDVYLTAIQSIKYINPVNLVGISGTAIRIKATDQLNGSIDQFNALVSNEIPDFDFDTGTWIVRATSNPASIYRYVLQGPANDRPLPDYRIDIAALEDWHQHCAWQGYSYNRVTDFETSVDQTLRDVAAAGAASPAIVDGKRTIVIDRIKDDIVQIITPRNSWGYSGQMAYPEMPHAFRVTFRNSAKGFLQDELIVYDDGYSKYGEVAGTVAATKFETLELQSCTDSDLAFITGRRHIATARLRPETHSFMLDIENLVALRGDRIKFEHDVPLIGIGDGRIKNLVFGGENITKVVYGSDFVFAGSDVVVVSEVLEVTSNVFAELDQVLENIDDVIVTLPTDEVIGFTLDDTVEIPTNGTYYARIRLSDGTQLYRQVTSALGGQETFLFMEPLSLEEIPLAHGDLAYIVEAGGELDLIITRIEPADELSARITALDYAPAIFTAESAVIPPFESKITTPLSLIRPLPPVLIQAQSDESVMLVNSDGTFTSRAVFTLRNDNEGDISVNVKVRVSGTDTFTNANIFEASPERVVVTGLVDGTRYDVHIRYKRLGSSVQSLPLQLNSFKFIGSAGPPADVTGFMISIAGDTAFFKWDANNDIDISHYKIKFSSAFGGASWETAQVLESAVYENRVSLPFQGGTYLIKAVDRTGNESLGVGVIITYDPLSLKDAVEIIEEHPSFAGVMDGVALESGSLVLANVDNPVGYYYFSNSLDLSGLFTSFVSSSIVANGIFFNDIFKIEDIFAEDDIFAITGDDIFAYEDIFAVDDIFGIGLGSWEVRLEYRITKDDPSLLNWSDWAELTAGNIEFWAIEFRLYMRGINQNISPSVSVLSVTVNMPDRIERGNDLIVPDTGATITFDPPFKDNPSVVITLQDAGVDDKIEFVTKTDSEFSFKVYNTTLASYVQRTYDFIASGYGRKNG